MCVCVCVCVCVVVAVVVVVVVVVVVGLCSVRSARGVCFIHYNYAQGAFRVPV